jgi:hypothetical protein
MITIFSVSNAGEVFLVGGFGKHRIILDLMDSISLDSNELQVHSPRGQIVARGGIRLLGVK